ncbi:MAG: hypothetical protein QF464_16145, partial [Myxococcota bacterium]|nr:hypothetical protein [Myxococcota bacterium]
MVRLQDRAVDGSHGQRLEAVDPLEATFGMDGADTCVDVMAPGELSVAELRWGIDKLCRGLAGLFPVTDRALEVSPAFSDETALTLSLDQHLASGGRARLLGRDGLSDRLDRLS